MALAPGSFLFGPLAGQWEEGVKEGGADSATDIGSGYPLPVDPEPIREEDALSAFRVRCLFCSIVIQCVSMSKHSHQAG